MMPTPKALSTCAMGGALWLLLAMQLNTGEAAAQITGNNRAAYSNQQTPVKAPKKRNRDRPENHAEHLKDFVDTPGLPKYDGKCRFVEGVVFSAANSGPSITMKFDAKAKPQDVYAWYEEAMNQSQWSIEQNSTTRNHRIGATKDKNICRVYVTKNVDPKYKSHVIVSYRFYRGSKQ